jgi:hypothetical protein
MAQSRASTWHPIIGSLVVCLNFGWHRRGSNPRSPVGERTMEAGLTGPSAGGTCYQNDNIII